MKLLVLNRVLHDHWAQYDEMCLQLEHNPEFFAGVEGVGEGGRTDSAVPHSNQQRHSRGFGRIVAT